MENVAGSPADQKATLSAPGAWDTHADQAGTLPENLKITADSLYACQRDLEARGIADRVLTLVWSEFGRRAEENGSGTDHGAAGIGFVIGTRASGRMIVSGRDDEVAEARTAALAAVRAA